MILGPKNACLPDLQYTLWALSSELIRRYLGEKEQCGAGKNGQKFGEVQHFLPSRQVCGRSVSCLDRRVEPGVCLHSQAQMKANGGVWTEQVNSWGTGLRLFQPCREVNITTAQTSQNLVNSPVKPSRCVLPSQPGGVNVTQHNTTQHQHGHVNELRCTSGAVCLRIAPVAWDEGVEECRVRVKMPRLHLDHIY